MTINPSDIQLLASERMTDAANGGGRMTSNAIVSGQLGNIFPKVSRTDAVYGRLNLRKIYGAVRSATLDMYGGAHAILADAPDDPKIGAVLFSTGSAFDTRTAARDRIESYVVAGGLSRMRLYGNQIAGSKAVVVYQRPEEPLPEAGNVYCLSVEVNGVVGAQQYIRVTDFTHEVRTFTDVQNADFSRRVLTMRLSAPLAQTFIGAEPTRFAADPSPTVVRDTLVADASRYYGIVPIVGAADQGALEVNVASVYAQIVPATTREVPVSLAEIAGADNLIPCASDLWGMKSNTDYLTAGVSPAGYEFVGFLDFTLGRSTQSVAAHRAMAPGSVEIALRLGDGSLGAGVYAVNQDGTVDLPTVPYIFNAATIYGIAVDHATGAITIDAHVNATSLNVAVKYLPAVPLALPAHTRGIPVTLATRGTVYTETLLPLPSPGSVILDYRALGKWYRLRDDGAGALVSDNPAVGTGSVDYATGAVVVTLGALPDVDSAVLLAWGSPAHTATRAGAAADAGTTVRQELQLPDYPLDADSVSVSYTDQQGVACTLTDSGGVLTGAGASGTVDYTTGKIVIDYLSLLPAPGTEVTVTVAKIVPSGADPITRTYLAACTGGAFDLGGDPAFAAITPGSLRGTVMLTSAVAGDFGDFEMSFTDDGSGSLKTQSYNNGQVAVAANQVLGLVDYNTGIVTATGVITVQYMRWRPWASHNVYTPEQQAELGLGAWAQKNGTATAKTGANGSFVYLTAAPSSTTQVSTAFPVDGVGAARPFVDLCRTTSQAIVPGSVMLSVQHRYYWDNNGTLYCRVDNTADAAAVAAGQMDYAAGRAYLTFWDDAFLNYNTAGERNIDLAVHSCQVSFGAFTAAEADFRTAGSPLRPASFYVQVTAADGELLTATTDQNGAVGGSNITGTVNQTTGVVSLRFGAMVTAAGNESQWWYNAANVVGGMIWRPREVLPATLRYNCVVQTALPLDASLLGVDPVRLPADGRVPVVRAGDIVVVHHSATTTLANPVTPGQTYSLGRTDLAAVSLADSEGVAVADGEWTANLAAGTVTIAADATLAGLTQPLVATHRIEQMTLCTDSQISGGVTFAAPLGRDYPAGSLLSTALPFGDLQARVSVVFDQSTWTGVWADALIGSQATAQYDDINYPIEVLNSGAITERWRISFTGAGAFVVIGENLGQIAEGTTAADVQVTNPLTGAPYFTLRAAGWGSGWATGNQLRFNTVGANAPIWVARTILGGADTGGDAMTIEVRGDTD